ncbi:MAG: cytochrome c oxidase accessory protein CcoG [Phycisphaerales bacterium]|nr:cytochrome c oxidase accessory protein CcoG [Phycisphaerales bacterium]
MTETAANPHLAPPAPPPGPPSAAVQAPDEGDRVLATLNADGSRRWLRPRLSPGRFLLRRRITAWALIALFTALPYIAVNGRPAMLFDIVNRRFHLFGHTFFPTDTVLMALLFLSIFLTIFFVTALFGRVWCGWACPQTVYMEFVYRPIERLIEGAPGTARAARPVPAPLKVLKWTLFLAVSCFLAHTFLAYFVGVENLRHWILSSPVQHPVAFAVMAAVTLLMLFDFAYFREQTCLVACPYGRLQAVMLDRHSLIVTYSDRRGEPRGKGRRIPRADVALPIVPAAASSAAAPLGDCIDCRMCVTTCPTGIDIRNGLQMECIGCAQCIDACDSVMDKIGLPRGLVGYSSKAAQDGQARGLWRPRTLVYPAIVLGLLAGFVWLLFTKPPAEAAVLPRQAGPFTTLPSGDAASQVRLRLVNRAADDAAFSVSLPSAEAARGVRITTDSAPPVVRPAEVATMGFLLSAPPAAFDDRGRLDTRILVSDGRGYTTELPYRLLGPVNRAAPKPPAGSNRP